MKIRLTQDIYRWENGQRLVFAKKGDILESGPLSEKPDWLVGCRTVELTTPLDDGRVKHLGEGYNFECIREKSDK